MSYQKSAEEENDEEQQFKQDSIAYMQKLKSNREKVNPQR
jgi:hypothetical protein